MSTNKYFFKTYFLKINIMHNIFVDKRLTELVWNSKRQNLNQDKRMAQFVP